MISRRLRWRAQPDVDRSACGARGRPVGQQVHRSPRRHEPAPDTRRGSSAMRVGEGIRGRLRHRRATVPTVHLPGWRPSRFRPGPIGRGGSVRRRWTPARVTCHAPRLAPARWRRVVRGPSLWNRWNTTRPARPSGPARAAVPAAGGGRIVSRAAALRTGRPAPRTPAVRRRRRSASDRPRAPGPAGPRAPPGTRERSGRTGRSESMVPGSTPTTRS